MVEPNADSEHADPDSWDALSPEARAAWLRGMDEADREYDEERQEHEDGANCCECGSEAHKCHDCPTFTNTGIDGSENKK